VAANAAFCNGGGLATESATVTISASVVASNQTTATSNASCQSDRDGGGLYNEFGTLTLTDSTVDNNLGVEGGGIENDSGTLSVNSSTVDHNTAAAGGGIANTGTATITNSTVAFNEAAEDLRSGGASTSFFGGGLYNEFGTLTLTSSTVAENASLPDPFGNLGQSGGIAVRYPVYSSGSIVADNTAGSHNNCTIGITGAMNDTGSNLESGTDCGFTGAGSMQNTDPRLASALASNGGPTQTLALLGGSPAIDAIPTASGLCTATDQRGVSRPDNQETLCDIGAYETVDDADLALTTVPANITVNATSPQGAVVSYVAPTVVDEDSPLPAVSCAPPSGGTFAIGVATVTCTVSDGDDLNSPVSATFTVTVLGAGPQTSNLISQLNGLHLTKSLQAALDNKLQEVLSAIAAGQTATACSELNDFSSHVQSQTGKGITASQATQLIAAATNTQAVLGC
jgi:hypothetical protein